MKRMRGCAQGRRGEILIPTLFVLPSLFVFVFLIYETAKISREKIRHQFAVDSAAFIEMTNYADFFNRTAYVNGAFPQRIFKEGFANPPVDRKRSTEAPDTYYNIMYRTGDFPRWEDQPEPFDNEPEWQIRFHEPQEGRQGGDMNGGPYTRPTVPTQLDIFTLQNAIDFWIPWDTAQDIYRLYVQIYSLLGQVEDAQHSVFQRLIDGHKFFLKSYWLNTGDDPYAGEAGAQAFNLYPTYAMRFFCVERIQLAGNKPSPNPFQPYVEVQAKEPIEMPSTIGRCEPAGLFQVAWINQMTLNEMNQSHGDSPYLGYSVTQPWGTFETLGPDRNYFNVNLMRLVRSPSPVVHATIALRGGRVWPNPTPKFQTKLSP